MHFMLETIIAAHLLGVDAVRSAGGGRRQGAGEERYLAGQTLMPVLTRPCDDVAMIRITDDISIDEDEIEDSFVRSSGPGGQNVNKLSTAVQLRFDVRRSPSLPNDVGDAAACGSPASG